MAIISCPECGRSVSDQAQSCPDCAFPISSGHASPQSPPTGHIAPPSVPAYVAPPVSPQTRPAISDQRLATAGWWGLFGALFAGGGLVLVWVAVRWLAAGAALGGMAAGAIGMGLGYHASGIAKQAVLHAPDAGRFRRKRAENKAVRKHAPMSGVAVLLGLIAIFANLVTLF